jgi:D-sedoheptulose 7-phosphate isomerase
MFVVALNGKDGGKMAGMVDLEIRTPMSQWADACKKFTSKLFTR